MSHELSSLLILATSGRSMAESARRGGYSVTVFDAFCDQDTLAMAACCRVGFGVDGLDPSVVLSTLESQFPECPDGLVYGAGLEGSSSFLSRLSEQYTLLGNDPAVVQILAEPTSFFELLDRYQIPHPEVRFDSPDASIAKQWLVKRAGSCGGMGVMFFNPMRLVKGSEYYFQRYLHGSVMSALFIADGTRHHTIGYNDLKMTSSDELGPLLYGGAIGQASLEHTLRSRVEDCIEKLVINLGLRGVNSLDFILSGGELFVIDLNIRPTATLELYEHQLTDGWMKRHVEACLGSLPEVLPIVNAARVYGHQIVYAPSALVIPAGITWPEWVKDRPVTDTRIARGEPVCSLLTQDKSADAVERRLQQYQNEILSMISLSSRRLLQEKNIA
ncbi:MAG: ATP-grasp domain-containing protein [Candidatus Thiodiazotropha sp. (ex Troendleina suluensis)]|nr:ATP-grasp domain-containing protein [Candidatus Thiodiazotropha sp. (ex Troendleina suluensis)]MCU7946619.1 ATP-grasp domain-containing protein [Candidatus Thiodiazotropha sp. (ex Cardiolucina cf. quadrata)]